MIALFTLGAGGCPRSRGPAGAASEVAQTRSRPLAVCLGLLGADFTVTEPPELVEYVCVLSRRYQSATQ